mmetsp:Transcript_22738/g.64774  ORF Transcript_22738/g.64774 Transcript_22738/m.64774 type:complete len:200 (+) Transcript_22738:173-772(+)
MTVPFAVSPAVGPHMRHVRSSSTATARPTHAAISGTHTHTHSSLRRRVQPELSHHERGGSRGISRVRRAATPAEGNAHSHSGERRRHHARRRGRLRAAGRGGGGGGELERRLRRDARRSLALHLLGGLLLGVLCGDERGGGGGGVADGGILRELDGGKLVRGGFGGRLVRLPLLLEVEARVREEAEAGVKPLRGPRRRR